MNAAQTVDELKVLARSRSPAARERLMLAIIDLCGRADEAVRSPAIQTLLGSIFTDLVEGAEADIRRILAEKLAVADWPPPALVNLLVMDEIEIARPIIAGSPVLKDPDLVRLLLEGGAEHRIEVAKRPLIGPPVVETILEKAEPAVMIALAGNDTADVSQEAMQQMIEASRELAGMRSPLVRHPWLRPEGAERLYAWVGQSLRSAIVSRFRVDVEALDRALAEAVKEAADGQARSTSGVAEAEQAEMERKLIAKLHAADQLRPSYLLRTLRDGRLSLFEAALAALGDMPLETVHRALNATQPDALALACAAVGLDRGAFSTLLGLVRTLNHGQPGGDEEQARRVFDRFGGEPADRARAAFLKAAGAV